MTQWLKLFTATTVQFGPFVDATDGVSLEVGLATAMDNATTGIRVSKNGLAFADRNSSPAPSYDAMGCYRVELDATDTNTLGRLRIIFEEAATCLPAWMDFMVVPAHVYDGLVLQTDNLQVDVTQWRGGSVPTPAATGVPDVNVTYFGDGAVPAPAATGVPDVNVTHWKDTAAAAVDTAGYPKVTLKLGTGSGEINVTAGIVENVTTVGTCTTNTDMITAAAVNAECDTAITDAALATATALATVDANVDTIKTSTDFINTTAIAELTGPPSATPTLKDAVQFLNMYFRNNNVVTGSGGSPASSRVLVNDAGTTIADAAIVEGANDTAQGKFITP